MGRDPHVPDSEESWVERGTDVERAIYFSDAVFAIAITLLALEIRVPEVPDEPAALHEALLGLLPRFSSFLLSFWLVGTYWVAHHRVYHHMRGYDRRLQLINLLFLMWIVLLPFSSSLLGEYGDQRLAAIVYAAHVGLAGLTLHWVWWYASRDARLMDTPGMDDYEWRYNELGMSVPLLFLISIGISFVNVRAIEFFWFLAFLLRPLLLRIL